MEAFSSCQVLHKRPWSTRKRANLKDFSGVQFWTPQIRGRVLGQELTPWSTLLPLNHLHPSLVLTARLCWSLRWSKSSPRKVLKIMIALDPLMFYEFLWCFFCVMCDVNMSHCTSLRLYPVEHFAWRLVTLAAFVRSFHPAEVTVSTVATPVRQGAQLATFSGLRQQMAGWSGRNYKEHLILNGTHLILT